MLSRSVRWKLVVFAVLGIVVLAYSAVRYANLGRFIGARGSYTVTVRLADAGGVFPDADVTYRGVSVGRVASVRLTASGVRVSLNISDSAPPIPASVTAQVADLSPVGEQYVDLRPHVSRGPFLGPGSVIAERDTQLPPSVTGLLNSIERTAGSLPLGDLRTVTSQLALGFNGQVGNLHTLLDSSNIFLRAAAAHAKSSAGLVKASKVVLGTQVDEAAALGDFAASANLLAHQLVLSDADLRRLIGTAPGAASQVTGLLADTNPALADLIANLLTTSEVGGARVSAVNELLSGVPAALADVSSTLRGGDLNVSLSLTFFNPLPCTLGYGGTVHRNGLDTSAGPPLNTKAACLSPPSSGIDVRGSANAPPAVVPRAAQPGLVELLGLGG
ncbi:MAG TPA: MlaD family protein [Streptosporangiaceae bacterium]|nr:MlaD family protein [Streptosporangiaceae bacterium]